MAQHFQNAIKHLSLGISQKVVIFRVFQQEFLGQLWPVLEEANQNLIDAGVLSDLKVTFKSQHKGESDYDEVMAQKEKEKEEQAGKKSEPEKKLDIVRFTRRITMKSFICTKAIAFFILMYAASTAFAAPYCAVFSYGKQCYYYDWSTCQQAAGTQGACVINQEEAKAPSGGAPFCVALISVLLL